MNIPKKLEPFVNEILDGTLDIKDVDKPKHIKDSIMKLVKKIMKIQK